MQIRTTLRYNFHRRGGQKSRNSTAYSNDKAAGKQAFSLIASGSVNWYNPHGRQFDNIPQNYGTIPSDPKVLLLRI